MSNQPQQQQEQQQFVLKLSISQINIIMGGLDELPHKFSRTLIDEIQKQLQPQIQSQGAPEGPLSSKVIQ